MEIFNLILAVTLPLLPLLLLRRFGPLKSLSFIVISFVLCHTCVVGLTRQHEESKWKLDTRAKFEGSFDSWIISRPYYPVDPLLSAAFFGNVVTANVFKIWHSCVQPRSRKPKKVPNGGAQQKRPNSLDCHPRKTNTRKRLFREKTSDHDENNSENNSTPPPKKATNDATNPQGKL